MAADEREPLDKFKVFVSEILQVTKDDIRKLEDEAEGITRGALGPPPAEAPAIDSEGAD